MKSLNSTILQIGDREIFVEIASSWWMRIKGLSGRDTLDPNRGMLFILPLASVQCFWMFGMKFPIDIIFLRDDVVVSVFSNVPYPKGFALPRVIRSHVSANRVLEVNAGKAREWGIKEGMRVEGSESTKKQHRHRTDVRCL